MEPITIDLKRGASIFKNRVEYPLPKKTGVKDYIFYKVSSSDKYGKPARSFFNKYYKNHINKKINNLEEIIDHLHSEIQSKNIKQIREIIIVAHGNNLELVLPVTRHAFDNEENKKKFQRTTSGSISNLQEAFKNNDASLTSFKNKRKEVIKKLSDISWITIRACNFGTSRDGLFALYSFFGGRANVYAPHEYQVFVEKMPIGKDSRIKSDLDFYQHLVKQGYIQRKKKHSVKRKEKIINKLIERGRGRHSFTISGYRLENNRVVSGDKVVHDSLISSFDQKKIPDAIKDLFLKQKLTLSEDIRIQIKKKNEKWLLDDDKLKINGHRYKIKYKIQIEYEQFSDEKNHEVSLYVYPILNHNKSLPSIPIQLFFSDDQAEEFKGELFELVAFNTNTEQGTDAQKKENFDAYEKLLNDGKLNDNNGHNIITAFADESPLTNPKIVRLSDKQWEIQDESTFIIKKTFTHLFPKGFKTALKVFVQITKKDQEDYISYNGSDPDTPGTELMAYLDNFSKEELLDLIFFLREPYKEEHAFYIYMAQEALQRKSDFLEWFSKTEEWEKGLNEPIYLSPWTELNDVEREHKSKYAYIFANVWREAKASSSRKKEFETDLFEEKELPFAPTVIEEEIDPDSPSIDPDLPGGVPEPPPEFFEKDIIFEEEDQEDISCQKFREALEVIKQNKGKSLEEIEKIFKETDVDENTTLYDYMTSNYGFNSFKLANDILQLFSPYASSSGSLISRLGTFAGSRIAFASSVFFAITGPLMLLKASLLDPTIEGKKKFKRAGTITGLKQGNKMIYEIIYKFEYNGIAISDTYNLFPNAPDHFVAHKNFLGTPLDAAFPSWQKAYGEGYKQGIEEVNKLMNEDLKKHMSIFKQYVIKKGLKDCHFKELLNSGLIDKNRVKLAILYGLYTQISKIARYDIADVTD